MGCPKIEYFHFHEPVLRCVWNATGRKNNCATMEENRAIEENQYFANVDATRDDLPYNYPDRNPLNTKVSKVSGKSEGLKITLKVMAGDTIEISAKAFYNLDNSFPGKSINVAPIVGAALAALTNPVGTVLNEISNIASSPSSTTLPFSPPSEGLGRLLKKILQIQNLDLTLCFIIQDLI